MKASFLIAPLLLIPAVAVAQTPPESPASPQAAAEAPPPPPASDTADAPMPVAVQPPAPVLEAQPDPYGPRREGFTLETSLGFGSTTVSGNGSSESYRGLAGLDLGIGGFASPNVAVTARFTGTTFDVGNDTFTSGFGGPHVQVWLHDSFFIGGGVGLALFDNTDDDEDGELGLGLDARVGWAALVGSYGTIFLSGEITPSFIDDVTTLGVGLKVGAQLF